MDRETAMIFRRRQIQQALRSPEEDEYYVIAANGYPKFAGKLSTTPFHEHRKQLGPSWELMNEYDDDYTEEEWEQWAADYKDWIGPEQAESIAEELIDNAEDAGKDVIVLMCYEHRNEYPRCHVWPLLNLLEQVGYDTDPNRPTTLGDF